MDVYNKLFSEITTINNKATTLHPLANQAESESINFRDQANLQNDVFGVSGATKSDIFMDSSSNTIYPHDHEF
jgi:hypothetical protein